MVLVKVSRASYAGRLSCARRCRTLSGPSPITISRGGMEPLRMTSRQPSESRCEHGRQSTHHLGLHSAGEQVRGSPAGGPAEGVACAVPSDHSGRHARRGCPGPACSSIGAYTDALVGRSGT